MTGQHYFVERTEEGGYAVRAQGSRHASALFDTQPEALAAAEHLNTGNLPRSEPVQRNEPEPDKLRVS